jgi:hypothetical protein
MVKTGTTVNINKVPEVLAAMRFLAGNRVLVGIPAEKNEREDEDGNTTPIGNAAIGFIQENGDPEMHLPARPWLKPGVATVNDQTTIALKKAGKAKDLHRDRIARARRRAAIHAKQRKL